MPDEFEEEIRALELHLPPSQECEETDRRTTEQSPSPDSNVTGLEPDSEGLGESARCHNPEKGAEPPPVVRASPAYALNESQAPTDVDVCSSSLKPKKGWAVAHFADELLQAVCEGDASSSSRARRILEKPYLRMPRVTTRGVSETSRSVKKKPKGKASPGWHQWKKKGLKTVLARNIGGLSNAQLRHLPSNLVVPGRKLCSAEHVSK